MLWAPLQSRLDKHGADDCKLKHGTRVKDILVNNVLDKNESTRGGRTDCHKTLLDNERPESMNFTFLPRHFEAQLHKSDI